eukprot:15247657-Alexandrium_andersonii.AAC.1
MSASLVGSEMCIRDRLSSWGHGHFLRGAFRDRARWLPKAPPAACERRVCLLYTSDAADDM